MLIISFMRRGIEFVINSMSNLSGFLNKSQMEVDLKGQKEWERKICMHKGGLDVSV